jgi:hypothetical protein
VLSRLLRAFARRKSAKVRYCLSVEQLESRVTPSVNVQTYQYGNARDGLNNQETVLTPENVNSTSFGQLFTDSVDGQVYAQPLEMTHVLVPGKGYMNLVYVATENDSVYAFNANSPGPAVWHDSFINPAEGITPVPSSDVESSDISPEIGITSTPVIDPATDAIYVVAITKEFVGSDPTPHYIQTLHALNLATGAEMFGGPTVIADTQFDGTNYTYVSGPSVQGTGDGSVNRVVTFNALREGQSAALLLLNGVVYISWASHGDVFPYHGWVLGYSASTLQLVGGDVLNLTPNGSQGGVWESGDGLAADSEGNIYLATSVGTFDVNTGGDDLGNSIVEISTTNGLTVTDYFTPDDEATLDADDTDQGSGGIILLPTQSGPDPNLLVQSGQDGNVYLLNSDDLGGYSTTSNNVLQELSGQTGETLSTPAFFNGTLYYNVVGDVLKAFDLLSNDQLSANPVSESYNGIGYPGATPTISANGTSNGIVWELDSSAYGSGGPAILYAYDASDVSRELYSSDQAPDGRDVLGPAVKFTVPTVANGEVFVGTATGLSVYGLLPTGRPKVFNTGVGANGLPLLGGSVDPHYKLVTSPDQTAPGPQSFVVAANGFPGQWLPNSPSSSWIAPQANQSLGNAPGEYGYETTVNLSGYIPSSAILYGQLTMDDFLVDVLVNGVSTGIGDGDTELEASLFDYRIDGNYFHSGLNTIEYEVFNGNASANPTGFRNEMTLLATPTTTSPQLPAGELSGDVGDPTLSGNSSFANDKYTLTASGTGFGQNGTTADQFHAVYQSLDGDGTIVAEVSSLEDTDPGAEAGVMIRETMDPGSQYVDMVLTAGLGSAFQFRYYPGPSSSDTVGPVAKAPYWVKLVRTGSEFTGYISVNGVNWIPVESEFIPMTTDVYIGLVTSADDEYAETMATFQHVSVTTQTVWGNVAVNAAGGAVGTYLAAQDFTQLSSIGGFYAIDAPIDTTGVVDPAPEAIYQNERTGQFTFTAPHLEPNQQYQIRLQLAEIYFTGPGEREFDVDINGQQVLTNFDILAAAGGAEKAIVEQFDAQSNSQGQIVVQFLPGAIPIAKLDGIQVLLASGNGSQVMASGTAIGAVANQAASFTVATFTDTASVKASSFTATIEWGDGTTSTGLIKVNPAGGFEVVSSHRYAKPGLYSVQVVLNDENDHFDITVNGTANVAG